MEEQPAEDLGAEATLEDAIAVAEATDSRWPEAVALAHRMLLLLSQLILGIADAEQIAVGQVRQTQVRHQLDRLMRARRNARDYERLPEHSEAHITWANITLMTRRITRGDSRRAAVPELIAA
jgi:hypothetical protein